jgi:hypothetical protein
VRLARLRRGLAIATAGAALLAIDAGPAEAKYVAGYCSPTGDYCTRVARRSGETFLGIATFSFTGTYTLCARTAEGADRVCKRFRLRKKRDLCQSFVGFKAQFSPRGPGRYCASWHKFRTRLGPKVCFAYPGR